MFQKHIGKETLPNTEFQATHRQLLDLGYLKLFQIPKAITMESGCERLDRNFLGSTKGWPKIVEVDASNACRP